MYCIAGSLREVPSCLTGPGEGLAMDPPAARSASGGFSARFDLEAEGENCIALRASRCQQTLMEHDILSVERDFTAHCGA